MFKYNLSMSEHVLLPIILCGGSGTRLWPLSRESFPKQYLSIDEKDKNSFLQKTLLRLKGLKNIENPLIICNEEHRFIVAEQMREINIQPKKILLEPFGKNTAPAVVLSALMGIEEYSNPNLLILSADHEIKNIDNFLNVIKKGIDYSLDDYLVTFGIVPKSPETGYGYIQSTEPFKKDELIGSKILKFTEKPDYKTAKKFLDDKHYTWNSGIFLFKAKSILEEIDKFYPDILYYCKKSLLKKFFDLDFQRLDKVTFAKCPNISIDYAVMEKTNRGIVLPMDVGWSDIGSWQSLWENLEKDKKGNSVTGKVILDQTKNSLFRSENRLVVGLGVEDLIVVDTNDVLLVANKKKSQDIKKIVNNLKKDSISEGYEHKKIYRPWGHYISVLEETRWKVKVILVKPGETLSLQMHHHRSEHWIVVNGTASVEINERKFILHENQSSYIPLGSKHRLSNPGKIPLKLIEVQSGSYVGEDDIERLEDNYGRLDN